MKAYTDNFVVKNGDVYREQMIYTPGKGWESKLVLWMPKGEKMTNFCDEYDSKKADEEIMAKLRMENEELMERVQDLKRQIIQLKGEIHALVYAVRCNGVSGADVKWEDI